MQINKETTVVKITKDQVCDMLHVDRKTKQVELAQIMGVERNVLQNYIKRGAKISTLRKHFGDEVDKLCLIL